MNHVYLGDCLRIMPFIPAESVDLIITSPPYADQRKSVYGSVPADEYVEWFLPRAREMLRVLKPTGSLFLNIKPHVEKGERSLYVMDLTCAIKREVGFKFVDEFCWTKNPFPNGLEGRFKNAFEPVYHFTKSSPSKIIFNPLACGTPLKDSSVQRAKRKQGGSPKSGSGMNAISNTNMQKLSVARPSNVIHANNVSNQHLVSKDHPATFPEKLVEFFVLSFSNTGSVVLDPFAGSGTTGAVCNKFGREYILIESKPEYMEIIMERRL